MIGGREVGHREVPPDVTTGRVVVVVGGDVVVVVVGADVAAVVVGADVAGVVAADPAGDPVDGVVVLVVVVGVVAGVAVAGVVVAGVVVAGVVVEVEGTEVEVLPVVGCSPPSWRPGAPWPPRSR